MSPLALTGNYQLAAALLVGMAIGFALVKADLVWRKEVLDALKLRNGRIIKTVLLMLCFGVTAAFFAQKSGLIHVRIHPSYLWSSLLGGMFCGVGLVIAAITPVTSICSLAAGRLHALWVMLGMALAIPLVKHVTDLFPSLLQRWDAPMSPPSQYSEFFSAENPGLYLAAVTLFLILLIHFTIGDPEE